MTIQEFRKHPYLAAEWRKLVRLNGIVQRVLQVMEENHPCRFALAPDNNADISPTRANIELGVTRGYSKYGDTLIKLAEPLNKPQNVGEPTYSEPQPQQEET